MLKLFISYSTADLELASEIAEAVRHCAEVFFWPESREPGKEVWPTIESWVDSADLVLAVITLNTIGKAMCVGQEVSRARAKGKTIIPLVAPGVAQEELGFLGNITHLKVQPDNLTDTAAHLHYIVAVKEQELTRRRWITGTVLVALAIVRLFVPEEK